MVQKTEERHREEKIKNNKMICCHFSSKQRRRRTLWFQVSSRMIFGQKVSSLYHQTWEKLLLNSSIVIIITIYSCFSLKETKSLTEKKPGSHFETPINFMGKSKQVVGVQTHFHLTIKNLKGTFMCKITIYNYFFSLQTIVVCTIYLLSY